MKHSISTTQKTMRRNLQDINQAPSTGSEGISLAPPAYGIESVDGALSESAPEPRQGQLPGAPVQMKADVSAAGSDAGAKPQNKTGLPHALKSGVESLSGLALDDVRVHYNSSKPAQLQAFAYTQGTNIHIGPGQERHLPHEAWHVVQQKQGRVKPTRQLKSAQINDDSSLEKEADVMGAKGFRSVLKTGPSHVGHLDSPSPANVLQRMAIYPNDITEMDRIICADLTLQHRKAGGEAYDWPGFTSVKNQSLTIDSSEGLILVGHGKPGSIEGMSGQALAKQLIAKVKGITSVKYIYISACNSASDSGGGKTLAGDLADALNIDGSKVVGAEGYKVNNLDDESVQSAVYYIQQEHGELAGDISAGLAQAYNLSLYEKNIAASVEKAEEIGTALIEVTSDFSKFMKAFAKAMSGDEDQIESVKKDIKDLVDENAPIFGFLDQAKKKNIAQTELRTGTMIRTLTSYEDLTQENTKAQSSQKSGGNQRGGRGCFITTACVQARGLPDDCVELTTLRAFRDEYILSMEKGKEIIKVYYQNAPAIVAAINQRHDALEIYDDLYSVICKCVDDIHAKKYPSAFQTYVDMVIQLRNRFTPLANIPVFFYQRFETH